MRIKRYDVTSEWLKSILKNGRHNAIYEIRNGLPEDAELVRISADKDLSTVDVISLFFTSESFPNLPEGLWLKPNTVFITKEYLDAEKKGIKKQTKIGIG